jgi:lysozyme family protein
MFDAAVNHGPRRAVILLQRALGVKDDGVFGPKTLAAVQSADEEALCVAMLVKRALFFRAIVNNDASQAIFLKGWLVRLRELAREINVPIQREFAAAA